VVAVSFFVDVTAVYGVSLTNGLRLQPG
jgi:hypothetical protein